MADTRTHIVGELYDTEKSYVESLDILVNKYMRPLKLAEVIDSSVVDEIFFQIPDILKSHEYFLDRLSERLKAWDSSQNIGDLFIDCFANQPMSEIYTAFINNWTHAKESIRVASNSKGSFRNFLDTASREHKGKLTLDALLIMPVQRIPRYELLIKELLKHTDSKHDDYQLLVAAQNQIHDLALKIDAVDEESKQMEKSLSKMREIESLIEGSREIELATPDRCFIRFDFVTIPGGLGTKKERCLFLFSDLLLITSIKRKSGVSRKASAVASFGSSSSTQHTLEGNKFKLLSSGKLLLENVDCIKGNDALLKKTLKEIESLQEDIAIVNSIVKMASNLTSSHQTLDESLKELLAQLNKQLNDKQNNDSQLLTLEITITSQDGVDSLTLIFPSADKRAAFECALFEAKHKLLESENRKPPPEFLYALPVRKITRSGLQFTCASATSGPLGHRDIWVCSSDGFVGQVYVLTLHPQPNIVFCNGVCSSRILCIAAIPGSGPFRGEKVVMSKALLEESFESTGELRASGSSSSLSGSASVTSPTQAISCPSMDCTLASQSNPVHTSDGSNTLPASPSVHKVAGNNESSASPASDGPSVPPSQPQPTLHRQSSSHQVKKPMNQFNLDSDSSSDDEDTINSLEEGESTPCPPTHLNLSKSKGSPNVSSSSPTSSASTLVTTCDTQKEQLEHQSTSLQSIINVDHGSLSTLASGSGSGSGGKASDIVTSSSSPCIPSTSTCSSLFPTSSSTSTAEVQSVSSTAVTSAASPLRLSTSICGPGSRDAPPLFTSHSQSHSHSHNLPPLSPSRIAASAPGLFSPTSTSASSPHHTTSPPLSSPKSSTLQMMSQHASVESDVESTSSGTQGPNPCSSTSCPSGNATMWMGTEDGCIHVFNSGDMIRMRKKKKIQLSATVNSIVYLDEKVYSGLSNGQVYVFKRDNELGTWNTCDPIILDLSTSSVLQLLAVSGKIWCAVQRYVKVLNTSTLEVELSFHVSLDVTRVIHNMVVSGFGVWISTLASPIIRLYHATTYECLLDVNVGPAVSKVLSSCDDIIRQHKSACLRVTSLLACKDLLFIGSSAGVILTLPLPLLTPHTTFNDLVHQPPVVTGISKGHTGHVRFLTSVEVAEGGSASSQSNNSQTSPLQYFRSLHHSSDHHHHHFYSKQQQQQSSKHTSKYPSSGTSTPSSVGSPPSLGITVPQTAPVTGSTNVPSPFSQQMSPPFTSNNTFAQASAASKVLVISGGDGFEEFTPSVSPSSSLPVTESTGRDDSTNHLLIWSM